MVYVFCAREEECLCFALTDDASLLPGGSRPDRWRILFQIAKSVPAIEVFRVDGATVLAGLDARGYHVATPLTARHQPIQISTDDF